MTGSGRSHIRGQRHALDKKSGLNRLSEILESLIVLEDLLNKQDYAIISQQTKWPSHNTSGNKSRIKKIDITFKRCRKTASSPKMLIESAQLHCYKIRYITLDS